MVIKRKCTLYGQEGYLYNINADRKGNIFLFIASSSDFLDWDGCRCTEDEKSYLDINPDGKFCLCVNENMVEFINDDKVKLGEL